jgi:predicted acetyltransferase
MSSTRLLKPSARLESSLRSFVKEFRGRGEDLVPWVLAEIDDDFERYVARLARYSDGRDVPEGFVPSSTFWLVSAAEEIVAVSNLRHRLTPFLLDYGGHIGFGVRPSVRRQGFATEILRRTVVEARALGIGDVLVTCDTANMGSARTIARNGGELWDERYLQQHDCVLQRYWIRAS